MVLFKTPRFNSFDYYILVIESVKNYCAYNGLNDPYNFKQYQQKLYKTILSDKNIAQLDNSNIIVDDSGQEILRLDTILYRIGLFIKYNNTTFLDRYIFSIKWSINIIKNMYRRLSEIYKINKLVGINNMLEINDQFFINIESLGVQDDDNPFNTTVLFKYSSKPLTRNDIDKYKIPIVVYDDRLALELDIPLFHKHTTKFMLDCRSDFYVYLMKKWETLFSGLSNCKIVNTRCSASYTRTGEDIMVWGSCEKFAKKTKKMDVTTIKFHKNKIWQKFYDSYKIQLFILFHL
jgi:hypothetical protein